MKKPMTDRELIAFALRFMRVNVDLDVLTMINREEYEQVAPDEMDILETDLDTRIERLLHKIK